MYQYELKPIHLYNNCRFLVGLLYGFHHLKLKATIYTYWIKVNPLGIRFQSERGNPSKSKKLSNTIPLQYKHPKLQKSVHIYIQISIRVKLYYKYLL